MTKRRTKRHIRRPARSLVRSARLPSVSTCLFTLAAALVVLFMLYIYFISASVINVVLREDMLVKVAETHSRISALETAYLEKKNKIDASYAQSLGFVALQEKTFVRDVGSEGKSLTVNQ